MSHLDFLVTHFKVFSASNALLSLIFVKNEYNRAVIIRVIKSFTSCPFICALVPVTSQHAERSTLITSSPASSQTLVPLFLLRNDYDSSKSSVQNIKIFHFPEGEPQSRSQPRVRRLGVAQITRCPTSISCAARESLKNP